MVYSGPTILYHYCILYHIITVIMIHRTDTVLGQSGLCRGHLLVPQTVCRWEVHDIHVILAG